MTKDSGSSGSLTIESYDELEAMRTQPSDVHPHDFKNLPMLNHMVITLRHIIPASCLCNGECQLKLHDDSFADEIIIKMQDRILHLYQQHS